MRHRVVSTVVLTVACKKALVFFALFYISEFNNPYTNDVLLIYWLKEFCQVIFFYYFNPPGWTGC